MTIFEKVSEAGALGDVSAGVRYRGSLLPLLLGVRRRCETRCLLLRMPLLLLLWSLIKVLLLLASAALMLARAAALATRLLCVVTITLRARVLLILALGRGPLVLTRPKQS